MDALLTCENIVKIYNTGGEKQKVIDKISVWINPGEFISVMGPSGSGKSTLMYALSGMDRIDRGKITFDGMDLSMLNENQLADLRRTKMGFVFQQPTLLKNLNILDNIILPSMRDGGKKPAQIIEKAGTLMKSTGISGLERREITQVSGGQLQRVGICRALMGNPRIIFADEPTGALNSASACEIMRLLAEIHTEGKAILLVTHDAKVAAWSERVLFLIDGRIAGEYRTSRNNGAETDLKIREEALSAWLASMER